MTTPMSAEEAMKWFDEKYVDISQDGSVWTFKKGVDAPDIRFAIKVLLASHTAYMLGKMPQDSTQDIHNDYAEGKKDGYNIGTRDARAVLEAEITELTK